MKKKLFLCIGLMFSAVSMFGQEVPVLSVTERDMSNVVFRYTGDKETVVEVKSNVRVEFESTLDKIVNIHKAYEENGFFFYELLFPTDDKIYNGRKLKIKSYGFETYLQPLDLKSKIPVGLLVINDTKRKADDFYHAGKYREALKEYEKLYSINSKDAFVESRIILCNDKINNGAKAGIAGRKVAIHRFSNETAYARGIFYDKENDQICKQAVTLLSTKLAASKNFVLFERTDMDNIREELQIADYQMLGVDYLIVGTITEFGRKNVNVKKKIYQIVQAGISVRLINVLTEQIIYADEAKGEAKTDSKGFDATLNDKAITDAVTKLANSINILFNN